MNIDGFYKLQNKKITAFGRQFKLDLMQTSDTDETDIWVFDCTSNSLSVDAYNALRLRVDFSHPKELRITTRICYRGKGDEAPTSWKDRERIPPQYTLKSADAFAQWIVDYMTFDLGEDWFTK